MTTRTPLQRAALAVAASAACVVCFMVAVVMPALTPAGLA